MPQKNTAPKKPHHKITLFLLKPDAPKDQDCVTEAPHQINPVTIDGNPGNLFLFRSQVKRPRWYDLVAPLLSDDAKKQFTSSGRVSALLFFSCKVGKNDRRFVLALGHGAHRLSDVVYETDFGRDTCLSLANTNKLISIDEQQFKGQVWNIRIQAAQASGAASFSFDPYSIVTKITAESKDLELGKRITGAESFVTNLPIVATDLPSVSEKLHKSYKRNVDGNELEWANRVIRVSDPELIESLNESLIGSLKESGNNFSGFLTPPRVVEWDETEKYKITGTGAKLEYDDWPNVDEVLEKIDAREIDIDFIKKCRLYAFDGDEKKYSWSLFRCLAYETNLRKKVYALANANWYQIETNFIKKIDGSIAMIKDFSPFRDGGAKRYQSACFTYGPGLMEETFNERVATALDAALFDRKLHTYDSNSHGSKVEPCDIFTQDGHFIHVKRYKGSCPLSHLFFQGLISATCLSGDPTFRSFMRNKARKKHAWIDQLLKEKGFKPEKFTTVYGIGSGTGSPMNRNELPIFSKIALAHSAASLGAARIPLKLWMI